MLFRSALAQIQAPTPASPTNRLALPSSSDSAGAPTAITLQDALERAMGRDRLTPLRERNPDVSSGVARAIEKALEVKPDDRYQSVVAFAAALLISVVSNVNVGLLSIAFAFVVGVLMGGMKVAPCATRLSALDWVRLKTLSLKPPFLIRWPAIDWPMTPVPIHPMFLIIKLVIKYHGVLGFWGDRKSTRLNSSH